MSVKTKLWYKIENIVAQKLGLKRIAFSGGQWPLKEDAEDTDIICQVKSTKGKQITIRGTDLKDLYKRSLIQHKLPVFAFHVDQIKYENARTWICIPLAEADRLRR